MCLVSSSAVCCGECVGTVCAESASALACLDIDPQQRRGLVVKHRFSEG